VVAGEVGMVLGQVQELQLLPDAAEPIWGVVAAALLLLFVLGAVMLFVRVISSPGRRRDSRRVRELEDRVDRLEGVGDDGEPGRMPESG
jgi:hypothetical protein